MWKKYRKSIRRKWKNRGKKNNKGKKKLGEKKGIGKKKAKYRKMAENYDMKERPQGEGKVNETGKEGLKGGKLYKFRWLFQIYVKTQVQASFNGIFFFKI